MSTDLDSPRTRGAFEPTQGPRVSSRGPRRRSLGPLVWAAVALIPLTYLTVFFGWPVLNLIGRGFVDDGAFSLAGFREVFSASRTWRIVGFTLGQAALGTVLSVALGLPGAYLLYRCRFPGRGLVRAMITVPFVLPTVVVGVAFRALLAENGPLGFLGLDQSFPAIIAALVFFNYSVVVRTVGGMWARLDPRTAEAARTLGASPARTFLTVTLPALGPAIASAASVVFLFCASAFGIVLMLGGSRFGTIETEIYVQTTLFLDLRAAAALSIVQLVVISGSLLAAGQLRGRQERALRLRTDSASEHALNPKADWPVMLVTGLVLLGLILPMLALAGRAFATPSGWGLTNFSNLATTGNGALTVPVTDAIANSLRTAVDATWIALTIGIIVSLLVSRRPRNPHARRTVRLLDAVFMLPLGVSAVTVGFGFLITLNKPPLDLRSSLILIPLAQSMVAVPLVVRSLLPVLRAIDPRLREAAASLGASPARVLATVDLPFLLRGLGLATGFAFAVSLGEFGATAFLSRPDRPTLPVVIYRLIGRPGVENQGMAMAAALLLAVITAAVMAIAERLRPADGGEW